MTIASFVIISPLRFYNVATIRRVLDVFKTFVEKSSKIFRKNSCAILTIFKDTKQGSI